jgi:hypothetical protein
MPIRNEEYTGIGFAGKHTFAARFFWLIPNFG